MKVGPSRPKVRLEAGSSARQWAEGQAALQIIVFQQPDMLSVHPPQLLLVENGAASLQSAHVKRFQDL